MVWSRGSGSAFATTKQSFVRVAATCHIQIQSEVVDQYLSEELRLNRIVKLTKEDIPKKNRPGKWRLIVDLSAPEGASTNDGVDKEACSLSYTSVDHIAARVADLGRGTLLAKMDVKQAYRRVPVHPSDRHLLGMLWRESVYVDKVSPLASGQRH